MIHAPIFRDIGQPNTGLTPLVEEQARIAMMRLDPAANGGKIPVRPIVYRGHANTDSRRAILMALVDAADEMSFSEIASYIGQSRQCVGSMCDKMLTEGLLTLTMYPDRIKGGRVMRACPTDAGRAWLEAQG